MCRKIIIGDIHGCFNELLELLNKININNKDNIFFVGDYTDRGVQSKKVFEKLKELKNKYNEKCVLIYGNHEDMMINCLTKQKDQLLWINNNGGINTLGSFSFIMDDYVNFILNNTTKYYETEEFNICHAGTLYEDLKKNDDETLLWDRYILDGGLYNGKLTIVGHTPVCRPLISVNGDYEYFEFDYEYDVPKNGIICIDTGCVYGGKLTAAIIENNKIHFTYVNSNYNYLDN